MMQVLPGDVARRILGPFADQRAVDTLNQELGTDRSLITQYLDWIGGVLTGDLGESQSLRVPVSDVLWPRTPELREARRAGIRDRRAAGDHRRRVRGAP